MSGGTQEARFIISGVDLKELNEAQGRFVRAKVWDSKRARGQDRELYRRVVRRSRQEKQHDVDQGRAGTPRTDKGETQMSVCPGSMHGMFLPDDGQHAAPKDPPMTSVRKVPPLPHLTLGPATSTSVRTCVPAEPTLQLLESTSSSTVSSKTRTTPTQPMPRKPTVNKTANHSDSDQTVPPSQRGRHHNLQVLPSAPHSVMQDGMWIYIRTSMYPHSWTPLNANCLNCVVATATSSSMVVSSTWEPDNQLRLLLVLFLLARYCRAAASTTVG